MQWDGEYRREGEHMTGMTFGRRAFAALAGVGLAGLGLVGGIAAAQAGEITFWTWRQEDKIGRAHV